ncbi:PTS mannitol transporter subunit IICB [Salinibacterium sp. ZJ454]|uniref:PTS mannitol transporter subunit IICB n=1 Tax=Salinibacterium sp. ZJ454 TaxID=2708339 RepID=UPI00141FCF88|nr:PTS mannitol transporter subunit IICB [Salinibacterium sp. ZJ454]
MSDYTPQVTGTGVRARIQRGGAFLAGMIMPNLGAFIAWGLITALFIPDGWVNQIARWGPLREGETLPFADSSAAIVGPIILFLLPILIGYTGGRLVHGQRGAVVGAVATMGVVLSPIAYGLVDNLGELSPQFLGALFIGPVTAWIQKQVDKLFEGRLKAGFEMLVDNFSAGIIGAVMALVGLWLVGPVVQWITNLFATVVEWLVVIGLLPLVSIIIEPAKVLFLNNALNHGVLTPLGADQAAETGKSILFMLESNPGPGFGVLTAMLLFGPRLIRPTVPAAMVVQFLGGIHEIYFPYVLMKPILIIAAICGGASGILMFVLFAVGLRAPASPGSIFAYILVSPPADLLFILLGILVSAGVSFIVGAVLLKFGRGEAPIMDLDEAQAQSAQNKNRPSTATA